MEEESGNGLIIACRGSRLNWQTTAAGPNNRQACWFQRSSSLSARKCSRRSTSRQQQDKHHSLRAAAESGGQIGRRRHRRRGGSGVADERREPRIEPRSFRPLASRQPHGRRRDVAAKLLRCSMFPRAARTSRSKAHPTVPRAREFFLLLSSTGRAFRRCELVWVHGTQVGIKFTSPDKGKKSTQS